METFADEAGSLPTRILGGLLKGARGEPSPQRKRARATIETLAGLAAAVPKGRPRAGALDEHFPPTKELASTLWLLWLLVRAAAQAEVEDVGSQEARRLLKKLGPIALEDEFPKPDFLLRNWNAARELIPALWPLARTLGFIAATPGGTSQAELNRILSEGMGGAVASRPGRGMREIYWRLARDEVPRVKHLRVRKRLKSIALKAGIPVDEIVHEAVRVIAGNKLSTPNYDPTRGTGYFLVYAVETLVREAQRAAGRLADSRSSGGKADHDDDGGFDEGPLNEAGPVVRPRISASRYASLARELEAARTDPSKAHYTIAHVDADRGLRQTHRHAGNNEYTLGHAVEKLGRNAKQESTVRAVYHRLVKRGVLTKRRAENGSIILTTRDIELMRSHLRPPKVSKNGLSAEDPNQLSGIVDAIKRWRVLGGELAVQTGEREVQVLIPLSNGEAGRSLRRRTLIVGGVVRQPRSPGSSNGAVKDIQVQDYRGHLLMSVLTTPELGIEIEVAAIDVSLQIG